MVIYRYILVGSHGVFNGILWCFSMGYGYGSIPITVIPFLVEWDIMVFFHGIIDVPNSHWLVDEKRGV